MTIVGLLLASIAALPGFGEPGPGGRSPDAQPTFEVLAHAPVPLSPGEPDRRLQESPAATHSLCRIDVRKMSGTPSVLRSAPETSLGIAATLPSGRPLRTTGFPRPKHFLFEATAPPRSE